jgi:hypothetical protein
MGYIIIEVPIEDYTAFKYAEFDKKLYKDEKEIRLSGEPVHYQVNGNTLTLIFKKTITLNDQGIVSSSLQDD